MLKIGIFADKPYACTGFARVCDMIARQLAKKYMVYYFGRFGNEELETKLEDGFATSPMNIPAPYLYVPCIGGVWNTEVIVRIIKHYNLDIIFSEDDWFSANGLVHASSFWKKPFHFLTPIDSLPIHHNANKIFERCARVYVPNSAHKILQMRGFNSVFLPHGVDGNVFKPEGKKLDKFCFLLIGRDDERKALGRAILAYQKIYKEMNAVMLIHTDWDTPRAVSTKRYINMMFEDYDHKFLFSQMQNNPHASMNPLYNLGHVNICTAKAGGFEMSITEAAAAEVPSIVNNWTFMRENIQDKKTGWLVNWRDLITVDGRTWANIDIDKLAKKMLWCYNNQELVKEAGIKARQFVTETFKWSQVGKVLRENIEESVAK